MRPLTPVPPLRGPGDQRASSGRVRAVAAVGALGLAAPAAYTVQPGDTLSEVARDHGVSVSELASINGIDDPDRILAGASLALPAPSNVVADRADAGAILEEVALEHGWSPRFVKALAWQESGWQQHRVSPAGAIGIMQVMPDTGRFVSQHLVGRDLDLDDPEDNVLAGVTFLQYVWELTGGDVEMTLAGYYQGLASVRHNGMYPSTERYIDNVLALRDRFR
jgi:N-acetylmuramoyl-L-alanine amidase